MRYINQSSRYYLTALIFFLLGVFVTYKILNSYQESVDRANYASAISSSADDYIIILNSTKNGDVDLKTYLICLLADEFKRLKKERDEVVRLESTLFFDSPLSSAVSKVEGDLKSIEDFWDENGVEGCSIQDW